MSESPTRRSSRKERRRSRSPRPSKSSKRNYDRDRSRSRERGRGRHSPIRDRGRDRGRDSRRGGEDHEDERRHRERERRSHRSRERDSAAREHGGNYGSRRSEIDEKNLPPPPPLPNRPREEDNSHPGVPEPQDEAPQLEQPDFGLSGKLAEETNKVNGIVLKYNEPPEARPSKTRWRLYVFKKGEPMDDPLYIHRNSWYLFGRDRKIADIPTDHPSCSKQHAVLQYRLVEKEGEDGMMFETVRPYLMDLGSTNGTFINGDRLDPQRYYELLEKDLIKFGNSSRDFILLHDKSGK